MFLFGEEVALFCEELVWDPLKVMRSCSGDWLRVEVVESL